jgi:Big-like domain-containing protein
MVSPVRLRALPVAGAFALLFVTLAACDPPPADEMLLGPKTAAPFEVADAEEGEVPADGRLDVSFTQEIDPRSIGARSVRVTRDGGRRPLRVRAWAVGRQLHVAPLPGRAFPEGEVLTLRLEGAPSPRTLRSSTGEPLHERFETRFRVGRASSDLVGPRLVASLPADGASDVAPGSGVELRFSEPLAGGSIVSGDAVSLLVDERPAPVRLQLSGDRTVVVLRPESPLGPGHNVVVSIRRGLVDLAGNPLDAASATRIAFSTRLTSLHELAEDFADSANVDARGTSCGWDDPETPGVLVARGGSVLVGPEPTDPLLDLGEDVSLRFQLLLSGDDVPNGLASALRIEFVSAQPGAQLRAAAIEAGATSLVQREPSFVANRGASQLRQLAHLESPLDLEFGDGDLPYVDIPFEEPLRLEAGRAVLLDVRLDLAPGEHVAGFEDVGFAALVEGKSGVTPVASLLVSTAAPQARSRWYDSGTAFPGWQRAILDADATGVRLVSEFQCAPADAAGSPDASLASGWMRDLSQLPAHRFVRFRLRFEGTADNGNTARIDRLVMPYER